MTLKATLTRLLSTSLFGFRNVPAADLPDPSFSFLPLFITETEMLAFRCSEKRGWTGSKSRPNPGQQKNRLE
jgi:hypothetical protein